MIEFLIFIFGAVVGYIMNILYQELVKYLGVRKNKILFDSLLTSVEGGEGKFVSRLGDSITIFLKKGSHVGKYIIYDKTSRYVSIISDNKQLTNSKKVRLYFPKETVVDDLIDEIEYRFHENIEDYVVVSGIKIDREYLDSMMKKQMDNLDSMSSTYQKKEESFNIDDILDKINQVGFEGLTDKEKNYLKNIK